MTRTLRDEQVIPMGDTPLFITCEKLKFEPGVSIHSLCSNTGPSEIPLCHAWHV